MQYVLKNSEQCHWPIRRHPLSSRLPLSTRPAGLAPTPVSAIDRMVTDALAAGAAAEVRCQVGGPAAAAEVLARGRDNRKSGEIRILHRMSVLSLTWSSVANPIAHRSEIGISGASTAAL